MAYEINNPATFPLDPLSRVSLRDDADYRRRAVQGVLESYHGNYDVLAEAVQNSVDALEDASLAGSVEPFLLQVTINLKENWISVLDSGVGMTKEQIASAFAPNISFKEYPEKRGRDSKTQWRGYKGVGLTFLAYGTDDITIHSKEMATGVLTKARMQYGCAWAKGKRSDAALLAEDDSSSPLDSMARGTLVNPIFE